VVTADDAMPPDRGRWTALRRRGARRGVRLPEKLALVGIAMIGFWPGEPWSATQVTLVVMCLLPLGVRSLLQWEDLLEVEPPSVVTREQAVARSVHALDNVAIPLAVIEAGPDGGVVREANPAMCELLGLDPTGRFWWYLVAPADRVAVAKAITLVLNGHTRAWRGLARHLPPEPVTEPPTGTGTDAPTWLRLQLIALPSRRDEPARLSLQASPAGAPPRLARPVQSTPAQVTTAQVTPDQVTSEQVTPDQATPAQRQDVLALLPDHVELTGRLTDLLALAQGSGTSTVVVHCAVEVGRPTTTEATAAVLAAVATRLLDTCRPDDLVARGDGDSLVVVRAGLDGTGATEAAEALRRRLTTALAAPLAVQDSVRTVATHLGLALAGPDDLEAAALVSRATEAAWQDRSTWPTATP